MFFTTLLPSQTSHPEFRMVIPVTDATDVKLELVISSKSASLHEDKVDRLVIDEDETHASLKGHCGVGAVSIILR